jgi:glycosyltransferase involved in cell wall biosynthesis
MDLALILPTFNAQDFIRENLTLLDSFLSPRFERYEIVVVDDGSTDGTSQTVRTLGLSNVRLLTLEKNQGKYSALKLGMLDSKAKFKLFTDVDLPYDLAAIPYMVKLLEEQKFHLVVGDRSLVNSVCDKSTGPLRQLTHHLPTCVTSSRSSGLSTPRLPFLIVLPTKCFTKKRWLCFPHSLLLISSFWKRPLAISLMNILMAAHQHGRVFGNM